MIKDSGTSGENQLFPHFFKNDFFCVTLFFQEEGSGTTVAFFLWMLKSLDLAIFPCYLSDKLAL